MKQVLVRREEQRIISLGIRAPYLRARALAAGRGGLSPVRHHRSISNGNGSKRWLEGVLVHPHAGGRFRRGMDVVDRRIGWVLPAGYIPKEAFEREMVGLLVVRAEHIGNEPYDQGTARKCTATIVHAASGGVVVLEPFIQGDRELGVVDIVTGVPLHVNSLLLRGFHEDEIGLLARDRRAGVTPLACAMDTHNGFKRMALLANQHPDWELEV